MVAASAVFLVLRFNLVLSKSKVSRGMTEGIGFGRAPVVTCKGVPVVVGNLTVVPAAPPAALVSSVASLIH